MLKDFEDKRYMCGHKHVKCPLAVQSKMHNDGNGLQGSECAAAAAFSPELAIHLARLIFLEVQRREREPCHECAFDERPVDVRRILMDAAETADKLEAEAPPHAGSYERQRSGTYCEIMKRLVANIGNPPPAGPAVPCGQRFAIVVRPQEDGHIDNGEDEGDEDEREEGF